MKYADLSFTRNLYVGFASALRWRMEDDVRVRWSLNGMVEKGR